ncbi:hypothetical protein EZH22_14005 [Xanthobacter dioxanivorans]|uniref:Uncharacterized protein n=1 Tax=Xanthobacter dioxanivorans TaxID=2528964 RepID=A0A974SKA0_9HYPH|nr:hypothetical protein [Xanthobacter dioxanivorans]QRG09266.1 hypothetical protein EZH22_14005 [Xanthobacter dioxanivorans]
MTRMNWGRARRWKPEDSLSRPTVATDRMESFGSARRPAQRTLPLPATASSTITLAYLAGFGFNRLSAWCPSCRAVARISFEELAAEHLDRAPEDLGTALACPDCGSSRALSPMAEKAVRIG